MRTLLSLATLCAVAASSFAANSIRFSETYRETEYCYREDDGDFARLPTKLPPSNFVICEEGTPKNSGRFNMRLTLPGLSTNIFTAETTVSLSFGGLSLEGTLGEAYSYTANRAVFRVTEEYETDDGDFKVRRLGSITLTRAGDNLRVVGSFSRLPSSIVASSHTEPLEEEGGGNTQSGEFETTLNLGELSYSKRVFYKARVSQRASRNSDEGGSLASVVVNGAADYTRPTIRITAPRNKSVTTNEVVTFAGTSRDNVGVSEVHYRILDGNDNDWFTCEGTKPWTAEIALPIGTNVVQFKSIDLEGNESLPSSRTVIRR